MITTRVLPPDEYHKLGGLPISSLQPPDPTRCQIVVVEDGTEIVGTMAVIVLPILEGVWVKEDYRKTAAFGRLWKGMQKLLKTMDIHSVAGFVQTPEMVALAATAGFDRMVEGTLCLKPHL